MYALKLKPKPKTNYVKNVQKYVKKLKNVTSVTKIKKALVNVE